MTGHDGYIGSHLIEQLKKEHTVDVWRDDIEKFWVGLNNYDMILHLAALTGVRASLEDPEEYWRVNVKGSKKVFDQAEMHNIPVVYFSSSNAKEWWTNPYAAT